MGNPKYTPNQNETVSVNCVSKHFVDVSVPQTEAVHLSSPPDILLDCLRDSESSLPSLPTSLLLRISTGFSVFRNPTV